MKINLIINNKSILQKNVALVLYSHVYLKLSNRNPKIDKFS